MSQHIPGPTMTTNGDTIKNEEQRKEPEKKSWWDRQPSDFKMIVGIFVGAAGFIVTCVAAGAAAQTVIAASNRATMNSKGFKDMLDRGVLDPIPPAKTLEEAAARIVTEMPRMLPVHDINMMS